MYNVNVNDITLLLKICYIYGNSINITRALRIYISEKQKRDNRRSKIQIVSNKPAEQSNFYVIFVFGVNVPLRTLVVYRLWHCLTV